MKQAEKVVEVRGLSVGFDGRTVLKDVDLEIYRGEILGVVGSSGSGKSVLLRSILGLLPLDSGVVRLFCQEYSDVGRGERHEPPWSVLFQDGALFSSLTVRENIQVAMREYFRFSEAVMNELASLKIDLVGLPQYAADFYPSELSGGMRKRAGLARALALDPEILFLDEPTAGLDPVGAAEFDELIVTLQQNLDLSIFMVTHDVDSLHRVCNRIAVLGEGRVIAVGTLKSMCSLEAPWVRAYFHGVRAHNVCALASDGE